MKEPPMRIAASFVGVVAMLGLALLLAAGPQPQQTKPSDKGATGKPDKEFQDDIHVKPKGLQVVGGYWTCAGDPCGKGDEKWLRDDLFDALSYLDVGGNKLDGVKFTLQADETDVVISVERDGTFFDWKVDGMSLKNAGYKVCKHNNPHKTCVESGIPGSWMAYLKEIQVRYECQKDYQSLTDGQDVHLKGRPTGK